ncbi:MAG: hypothetical protein JWM47_3311 [Acidimicrobiales bacterium]|nr:hypothetical protein [Acidimicrobiales bacterium]
MMHGPHQRATRPPHPAESGAVMVEMALIAIFLVTLAAGAYDFGKAWRGGLALNEASRTGARVGSAQGPVRAADYYALSGLKASLTSSGLIGRVTRIVVFSSTSPDGVMPEACKTTSTTACQVITGTAFRTAWETGPMTTATTTTGCLQIATAKNWCPTTRTNTLATAEYYGVWIQMRHTYDFPLLGTGVEMSRTTVMRLEPTVE